MLQLGNLICAHSLTINYYVGKPQKKPWDCLNVIFIIKLNFLFYFFWIETPHRGRPSSAYVVTFTSHALCSSVSRRKQKNTKLLKTNNEKCSNYKSKVKIDV